jgi:hypothetical protein
MNEFKLHVVASILRDLAQVETACTLAKINGQGGLRPADAVVQKAMSAIEVAEKFFALNGMVDSSTDTLVAKDQWNRMTKFLDVSGALEIVHRLQSDIVGDLQSRNFLRVEEDRSEFLESSDYLFGQAVHDSFNSAVPDIKEAGNCLATECNTAAVFHLMRASEVALRAMAKDRDVVFANKPIDQQEWGTILSALEGKLKAMREDDQKNWPESSIKDTQVRFYSEIIQELRGFNEAWRRHLSHARDDAFYDRDYAKSVLTHVRSFMQKIAERISEGKITPKYWPVNT